MFLVQIDELLPQIRSAAEHCDSAELARSAHKLNGSVGSLGFSRAQRAAQRLEIMGRSNDLADSREALADLEREMSLLRDALTTYLADDAKS